MSDQDLVVKSRRREEKLGIVVESDSNYVQNIYSSIFKYVFIVAGSLIDSAARFLIFNVIALFGVRDRVKTISDNILSIQLSIIETMIIGNIFLFRLLCKVTGTRIKRPDNSDAKYDYRYDNRGYLRYSEIHRQYWGHKDITYKDEMDAYSVFTNLSPITKFLDIEKHETVSYNDMRPDHNFEPHTNNENKENGSSATDSEAHKKYFSFYRKQKKLGDSQSFAS